MEQPKEYTQEEIAQLEKSRTISDAELLKGGAEYAVDENSEKENLLATEKQKENIPENIIRNILNKLEKSNKKIGSLVSFKEKGQSGQFMATNQ